MTALGTFAQTNQFASTNRPAARQQVRQPTEYEILYGRFVATTNRVQQLLAYQSQSRDQQQSLSRKITLQREAGQNSKTYADQLIALQHEGYDVQKQLAAARLAELELREKLNLPEPKPVKKR